MRPKSLLVGESHFKIKQFGMYYCRLLFITYYENKFAPAAPCVKCSELWFHNALSLLSVAAFSTCCWLCSAICPDEVGCSKLCCMMHYVVMEKTVSVHKPWCLKCCRCKADFVFLLLFVLSVLCCFMATRAKI